MKKRSLAIAAFLATAVVGVAARSWFAGSLPVDVYRVRPGRVDEITSAVSAGTVESPLEAVLSSETGGRVSEVRVREGSVVRKGDLLARTEDPELSRQLVGAQSEEGQARDALRQAEARREEVALRVRAEKARAANNLRKAREDYRRASELFGNANALGQTVKRAHNRHEDFTVTNQAAMLSSLYTILDTLTYVLAGIVAISLLVGGIGVMNIMLVTVKERTNEIGIRKAVGAREQDILLQFLLESTTLSAAGGIGGVLFGLAGAGALRLAVPKVPVSVPSWAVLLAFTFSAFVGVFFGVYPARKAASLNPIEALRYE